MRTTLPDGTPVELALPRTPPARGVVIVPDIMGLRPLFDDMCARLASEHDWAVAAVEPFPGLEDAVLDERFAAMPQRDDGVELRRLHDAASLLRERVPSIDEVAVVGFCQGGMYALKASRDDTFDRAVSFYGMIRVPDAWEGAGQGQPLDAVARRAAQVLAICGAVDPWTPADDIAALWDTGVDVVVYDECDHGFVHDPARPAHRPDDAADAWRRVTEFLA